MTAFGMLPTFLITYLYEKLNSTWRHTPTLRSSRLYHLSPMINVFLAGLPTLLLSTPTSMLMTLIHSEQLSAKQALTKMKAQHFKAYVDIYRSSIVTMSIFFCIRQQLIENEQYVFQRKLRMTEKQSILATAVVSSVLANVIYQPVEALQARLVVENKDGGLISVISNLRRQKNCVRTLFKGFCTKTTSTGIFNCVYFPVYSKLKNEFSLRVY
jgi:Na+-transporting NADH:ubiquinone oxidoreductase subunit NqrB